MIGTDSKFPKNRSIRITTLVFYLELSFLSLSKLMYCLMSLQTFRARTALAAVFFTNSILTNQSILPAFFSMRWVHGAFLLVFMTFCGILLSLLQLLNCWVVRYGFGTINYFASLPNMEALLLGIRITHTGPEQSQWST